MEIDFSHCLEAGSGRSRDVSGLSLSLDGCLLPKSFVVLFLGPLGLKCHLQRSGINGPGLNTC